MVKKRTRRTPRRASKPPLSMPAARLADLERNLEGKAARLDGLAVKLAALERELDAKWQNLKGEIAGLRSLCKETIESCNRDEFATAKAVYRLIEAAHKAEKGRHHDER